MEHEQERIVKGIWIPIEIWKDKNLTWNEKILLLEIDSFTSQDKDCYFSNKYISELLDVNETTANKILSSLIKKGYVVKTKFDGRNRYVKSNLSGSARQGCAEVQGSLAFECNIINNTNNNIEDNNKEKKENILKENKEKRFKKPTVEEIQAYIAKNNYHIDAEHFFNYYESNGWRVGKSPMKSWTHAVANWERMYLERNRLRTPQPANQCQKDDSVVIGGQTYK